MSTTREKDMRAGAANDRDHWGASNFADGAEYGRKDERTAVITWLERNGYEGLAARVWQEEHLK